VDGAGRVQVLLRIVVPLARPGIAAVAILVAVFTWNDFAGALVLIQRPDAFTVQLALTRFSTLYATDQGLTFAGMAIVILPPLLLFVVLRPGLELDDALRKRIADALRNSLSPRHAPDTIVAVPAIPRTLTGKKLEVPVKRILSGDPPELAASRESLADPTALDPYVALAGRW